ncbi:hypothetical protein FIV00_16960 [Labrenzia sp. THAF82]|nr:hypothetical protein FIV00_16960 [Labrenzia sp. THAF82]
MADFRLRKNIMKTITCRQYTQGRKMNLQMRVVAVSKPL